MSLSFLLITAFSLLRRAKGGVLQNAVYGDSDLSPVAHNFLPPYIKGLYLNKAAEALTPQQCPVTTVIHQTIGECTGKLQDAFVIPHRAISHDGKICGTGEEGEYTIVVPGGKITDATTAALNGFAPLYGLLGSNPRAKNAFKVLNGLDPVYVGFEYNGPRICEGHTVFENGTVYIFLTPSPKSKDLNFGFAYLGVSEIGMVSVKPNQMLCLYKESRGLGPGQMPFQTPTPSPSPGKNYTLPDDIFDLDNPIDLDPCFPAVIVQDLPRPSKPPRPSSSVTPSSTPSNKPTPSASISSGATAPTPSASPSSVPTSPTPSATASRSDSPDRNNGDTSNSNPACFPGSAKVMLSSGSSIQISSLRIGDKVQVGPGTFSEVFMFTHQTDFGESDFIRIRTKTNLTLSLSPGHYLPASGRLRAARTLKEGDSVSLGTGQTDLIAFVDVVVSKGLYNPQTLDGAIVVDGLVSSTFTEAINPSTALPLLASVKFLYSSPISWPSLTPSFKHGNKVFVNLLPTGPAVW